MDATPLYSGHWLIVVHSFAALAAVLIGAVQLSCSKGTANHRLLGYMWVTLIVVVSVTSFGIFEIRLLGPFSPIHFLSVLVIATAIRAVTAVRAGHVQLHKKLMNTLYFLALIITGLFTLAPGRVMHQVVFGG